MQSGGAWDMFNLVSIIIGIGALGAALLALLPPFGAFNMVIVPLAAAGVAIGLLSRGDTGRRLNTFVLAFGVIRLVMGAGWF
ncbi:MAG: hypothetical protein JWR77_1114 [Rhizorhabdus sp.]|nr:hypothetical protein [Rhizorhabdus sp.]